MLEKIKIALRISHTALDDEILTSIEAARQDMIRAGVSRDALDEMEGDVLLERCVKTYVLAEFSNNEKMREKFEESYRYQLDVLRKSTVYSEVI